MEIGCNRKLVKEAATESKEEKTQENTSNATSSDIVKVDNSYYASIALDSTLNDNVKLFGDLTLNFPGEHNLTLVNEFLVDDKTKLRTKVSFVTYTINYKI